MASTLFMSRVKDFLKQLKRVYLFGGTDPSKRSSRTFISIIKNLIFLLWSRGSVGWRVILCTCPLGHMPGLWVQSPVGVHTRNNQSMFLSPLPPKINGNIPSGEDLKKIRSSLMCTLYFDVSFKR